jgi:hypothetical protein
MKRCMSPVIVAAPLSEYDVATVVTEVIASASTAER